MGTSVLFIVLSLSLTPYVLAGSRAVVMTEEEAANHISSLDYSQLKLSPPALPLAEMDPTTACDRALLAHLCNRRCEEGELCELIYDQIQSRGFWYFPHKNKLQIGSVEVFLPNVVGAACSANGIPPAKHEDRQRVCRQLFSQNVIGIRVAQDDLSKAFNMYRCLICKDSVMHWMQSKPAQDVCINAERYLVTESSQIPSMLRGRTISKYYNDDDGRRAQSVLQFDVVKRKGVVKPTELCMDFVTKLEGPNRITLQAFQTLMQHQTAPSPRDVCKTILNLCVSNPDSPDDSEDEEEEGMESDEDDNNDMRRTKSAPQAEKFYDAPDADEETMLLPRRISTPPVVQQHEEEMQSIMRQHQLVNLRKMTDRFV
eukprot:GILI01003464.1.p1 GENE.GILI01003464.1~~GILI01003464.1.p1  ORF type:complete len:406 (-),score=92.72 GILI01003464.1:145-1257(-)